MILCIFFLMECTCPSQNLISDVLLCFLFPFSEIVSFVPYQKGLFQYFVKSKWQVWICFHFICMLLLRLCPFDLCTLFNLYIFLVKLYMPSTLRGKIVHWMKLLLFWSVCWEKKSQLLIGSTTSLKNNLIFRYLLNFNI
jgi:hypothetical protein